MPEIIDIPVITPTMNMRPDQVDESVIIDVPEELEPDLNTTCWIHRVPIRLRQVNQAAYTPQLVSIGPFHHGKPKFKSMEGHKDKYLQQFWKRDFCKHIVEENADLHHVRKAFMKKDARTERILRCYAATLDKDDDSLVELIFRDACFIFELFLRNYESYKIKGGREIKETNDYILSFPLLLKSISLDLMLLENQIPFFVFTELFDFILETQPVGIYPPYLSKRELNEPSQRSESLLMLVIEFFGDLYPKQEEERDKHGIIKKMAALFTQTMRMAAGLTQTMQMAAQQTSKEKISDSVTSQEMRRFGTIKHFTDLVRQFLFQEEPTKVKYKEPEECTNRNTFSSCSYSAKKLDRAGVKFEYSTNAWFADIDWKPKKFRSLIVKVPKFTVQDDTEYVLRNVMALEQCLYPRKPRICNYIALLGQLIDTAEDVELLIEKHIAQNLLGSNDAVAELINKLCEQIVVTSCYVDLYKELNGNYNNWWGVSKETLKRVYFKDLWTGSSTVLGLFVTLFTIVSVISAIVSLSNIWLNYK